MRDQDFLDLLAGELGPVKAMAAGKLNLVGPLSKVMDVNKFN